MIPFCCLSAEGHISVGGLALRAGMRPDLRVVWHWRMVGKWEGRTKTKLSVMVYFPILTLFPSATAGDRCERQILV